MQFKLQAKKEKTLVKHQRISGKKKRTKKEIKRRSQSDVDVFDFTGKGEELAHLPLCRQI